MSLIYINFVEPQYFYMEKELISFLVLYEKRMVLSNIF